MTEGNNFSNSFSLTDEIVDIIRERILKGEYKIGEKIKENQIATELRVSRTPIREAFKQLENEGLIDYIPNRGCFAKGFTRQDIEDIYAVRKALEILAVEWAVNRITPEQIQNLQEQSDLMEFYTTRKDSRKVLEINTDFHDIIYNATGSRFMAQVLRSYKEYIEQTRKVIFYEQSYLEQIFQEHRTVLEAIKAGDTAGAKEAMAKHLDGSQRRAELIYNIK
ncbi:MAG: GntR family transcriptional regulator [Emergencia sp.]